MRFQQIHISRSPSLRLFFIMQALSKNLLHGQ
jgi:hypothetical protein